MWGEKLLGEAALGQVRKLFREELRKGLEEILNPAFVKLVNESAEDLKKICDHVLASDGELGTRVQILEKAVEHLQSLQAQTPPAG